MATYFHGGSEIQGGDGLQTLYLMNPNYVPYSDSQQQPNMFFFNPNNTLNPMTHQHTNPNQHLVGIPLAGANSAAMGSANSDDPSRPSLQEPSGINGMVPRVHYNLWGSMDHHAATAGHPQLLSVGNSGVGGDLASELGLRRPVQQGLSLSLSSQQHAYRADHDMPAQGQVPGVSPASGEDHMRVSRNSPSSVTNGFSSMQSVLLGSKYLKATQELLDEVVNVGKGLINTDGIGRTNTKASKESMNQTGEGSTTGCADGRGAELSTAQRQELQMKKAKLVTMLDEVGQRYRQYHHQMQIVVSSFEQAAGLGSAKSYTALALQTISKQFRCLKDAITSQIKATSKSLGEDDCLGAKVEGSRLRQVDHQLRRQRALQQLGMVQHNAWRPQRGLPERAVSVLRAWLFEHFLHPYPKDSDKIMLAKQTGLTRSQVSNWFINARVRLWKPMVEEMYMEEVKEREQNGLEDNTNKNEANGESGSKATAPEAMRMDPMKAAFQSKHDKSSDNNLNASSNDQFSNSPLSASAMGSFQGQLGMFNLIGMGSSDMEAAMAQRGSPNKPRSSSDTQNSPSSILSMDMDMKRGETGRDQFGGSKFGNPNLDGGFGSYQMGDMGRFNVAEQLTPRFHGNGVSLTLGLPHCDNLSMSGTQQNYLESLQLGRKLEVGAGGAQDFSALSGPQPSHSGNGYESIDIQNRKSFAAQLLPDFVS